jgi:hypothetical protein
LERVHQIYAHATEIDQKPPFLFSCRVSSCLKCGCSERHLRLLLSDFPVSFQDVKSISIGAFNSKRAPWNSWLFGCLGTLKDLKVGLENPETIAASKHGENRHNRHNLKSERHCFKVPVRRVISGAWLGEVSVRCTGL